MPPMTTSPRRSLFAASDFLGGAVSARGPKGVLSGALVGALGLPLCGPHTLGASPSPLLGTSPAASRPTPPTQDPLALAEAVRARWVRVDHAGHLWARE